MKTQYHLPKAAQIALEAAFDWAMDKPEYDSLCVEYAREIGRELTLLELQCVAWHFWRRECATARRMKRRPRPSDYLLPEDAEGDFGELAERANAEYRWLVKGAITARQMADAMQTALGIARIDIHNNQNEELK